MGHFPAGGSGGGSGTISDITSTGATVTITAPTGPTTNLEVAGAVTSFNTRTGAVALSDADVATILAAFTSTLGVSVSDNNAGGISIVENAVGGNVLIEAASGTLELAALNLELGVPSHLIGLYTGTNLGTLSTPPGVTPAFGLTADGEIYFYPVGGPWQLAGGAAAAASPGVAVFNNTNFGG